MSAAAAAAASAQVILVLAVGWAVADMCLVWARGRDGDAPLTYGGGRTGSLGPPERWLFAIAGFVFFAVAAQAVHDLSGGRVFDNSLVVPIGGIACITAAFVTRRLASSRPGSLTTGVDRQRALRTALKVGVIAGAVAVIFFLPVVRTGTGARTGDTPWHMGWTQQLLAGEEVPTGPAARYGRNGYPWGWHAVNASMVRMLPGSDVVVAHDASQVIVALAIVLAAACLARRIDERAGWAAAIAVALVGGFGWLSTFEPTFIASPTEARYGADLIVASPNSAYELFAPAFPRELGLALLGCAGVLAVLGVTSARARISMLAGVTLGSVGLISVPMLVSGGVWVTLASLVAPRGARLRSLVRVLLPAAAVFGLWAIPVAVDYLRFDGFVNVTPQLGVEWPFITAMGAWGLLLPAAVAGMFVAVRSPRPGARIVLVFAAGTIAMLALARARAAFGWSLAGNATALHQGRVWPVTHLLGAAFAGASAVAAFHWLAARSRAIAIAATAVTLLAGSLSLVIASRGFHRMLTADEDGFEYSKRDRGAGSFARRVADRLGPDDVVRVEGTTEMAFMLFAFSGMRIAAYDDPRLDNNDLRIRFKERADAWDRRIAVGGFDSDYVVEEAGLTPGLSPFVDKGVFEGRTYVFRRANPGE